MADVPESDLPDKLIVPDADLPANAQLRALAYRSANPPPSVPISPVEAGSMVGGVLGIPSMPVLGPMGPIIGTAAGASIGKSAQQLYEQSRGNIKSVRETLGEYPTAVAEQTGYQIIGQGIGSGVAKTLNAALPAVREGAAKAQELLMGRGGSLSASQVGHSSVLEMAESFARAGAGGKGRFIELDKRNADALQAIKDDLIQGISKAPVDDRQAGLIFSSAISKGDAAHAIAAQALYKDFDSRVGGALVDSAPVQQFGLDMAERLQRIGNVGKSEAGGRLIDQLKSLPNTMTFSDAQALRSNLLAQVRDLDRAGTETKALATAKQAASLVDQSMNNSAQGLSDDLVQQFRQINNFYKQGKQAFNNDVVRDLIKAQPERVGETLFKSGNVSEIMQVRESLDFAAKMDKTIDKEAVFSRLQAGYLNTLLTSKAATNIEGETTAQNLMKTLAEAKTLRQFEAMFTEKQRESIADFGRTAYLALRNKPASFGILAPLLQAAAIGDLAMGSPATDSPFKDVGVLVSPYALSVILTNPKAVNILAKGLQLGSKMEAGSALLTKFATSMSSAMADTPQVKTPTPPQPQTPPPQIPQQSGGLWEWLHPQGVGTTNRSFNSIYPTPGR